MPTRYRNSRKPAFQLRGRGVQLAIITQSGDRTMLQDKTAIVTGSTSGIGLGLAEAFAREGANVVLNGFGDAMQIEETRAALAQRTNARVVYSPADMSKPRAIEQMIRQTADAFGGVDIMVNNAGIQHVAPIEEFPDEKWDAILSINLSSAFHATKLVLPMMRRKGWGRVINVASAHALVASPYKAAYVAAKHGVLGLTKVTALEAAEDGITCNALCPGYVRTPLVEKQIDDQARAHGIPRDKVISDVLLKNQPNKRFVEVDELAALALFLCSDNGGSVTGAALPVDGGWTAH
jgi:3-hydroxybutyrate dehydrogenase